MVAAIYARKSVDEQTEGDLKSVARQVANARAFAATKGWTVDESRVFTDDAVSGADAGRLKGRQHLLASLDEIDVLIMRDDSRLTREDMHIAQAAFIDIAERG